MPITGRLVGRTVSVNRVLAVLVGAALLAAPALAVPTTPGQARKIVRGWLDLDGRPLNAHLARSVARVTTYDGGGGRAVCYVVHLEPEGFVIVAPDDEIEPIIAFSPAGTFEPGGDDPLGALLRKDMTGRLEAVQSQAAAQGPPVWAVPHPHRDKWQRLTDIADGTVQSITGTGTVSDIRVAPRLASRWGQQNEGSSPCYNYYTPNGYPCGCVATSMAQLMRYHEHPAIGIGTHRFFITVDGKRQSATTRGGDGAGGPYNWTMMPLDPSSSTTAAQREAIGALCYDAGLTVRMNYAANASGASFLGESSLVDYFHYGNAVRAYHNGQDIPADNLVRMINPNLDAGYPVLLAVNGDPGGHAVIADGYGYNAATLYHHLNMGWYGYQDAWYNLPLVDTSPYTFTAIHECGYNIFPTGQGEIISGRIVDDAGNPVAGATATGVVGGAVYTDTSDSQGIYALAKVPSNTTCSISVSHASWVFQDQIVTTSTSIENDFQVGNLWGIDFAGEPVLPTPPAEPVPADAGRNVALDALLEWNGGSAEAGVVYDVYLDMVNPPVQQAATGLATAWLDPGPLDSGAAYYWQVVARNSGGEASGAVWSLATMIPGDTNGDGSVNAIDLLAMAHSWNTATGDAAFDPACDFNGDGFVNAIDLLTMAGSWGRQVASY